MVRILQRWAYHTLAAGLASWRAHAQEQVGTQVWCVVCAEGEEERLSKGGWKVHVDSWLGGGG